MSPPKQKVLANVLEFYLQGEAEARPMTFLVGTRYSDRDTGWKRF